MMNSKSIYPDEKDLIYNQQLIDTTRANIYGILGRLYDSEITQEFANEMHQMGFLKMLSDLDPDFAEEGNFLPWDFKSHAVEFARLFIGPGPHSPPYASVYRQDDERGGQFWGNTTGEVKRFMVHYGLKLNKQGAIPDHISVLFEFMERLIRAKVDASGRNDQDAILEADKIQRYFYQNYIEPWVEKFLQLVQQANPLVFYGAVIKYTSQFIVQEKKLIMK